MAALREAHPYKLHAALSQGADPNFRQPLADGTYATPLAYLLCNTGGRMDTITARKVQGMLEALLDAGADPSLPTGGELPYQTVTKLDHPACNGSMFTRLLRGVDRSTIDMPLTQNNRHMSALAHAFHARQVGRSRQLIQRGADPWKRLPDGQPAWILLGRTNWKSIDRHRQPQPAHLMREMAKTRDPKEVLDVVLAEADLLRRRDVRRDGYGEWAMEMVMSWLVREGSLSHGDLQRLAQCTHREFSVPLRQMLQAGLDPNTPLPEGGTLAWRLLESEDSGVVEALMNHPGLDITQLSPQGEDMASFLRGARWLTVESKTREDWISRVQAELLARSTSHPTPGSKPHGRRL